MKAINEKLQNAEFSVDTVTGKIKASGNLSKDSIAKLFADLELGKNYVFDFKEAKSISYGALRALLNAAKSGYRFVINNVCDQIALQFFDTGLDSIIPVTRCAAGVNMEEYERFGGGFAADSYYSKDGDAMLKLYRADYNTDEVLDEQRMSNLLVRLGVMVPLPGSTSFCGDRFGVEFERIVNKKSFAKACSLEPEKMPEYAKRFADMSKKFHGTACDTSKFMSMNKIKIAQVQSIDGLTDIEKQKIIGYINSIEERPYLLHGDFHHGNALITDEGDMFVDLGEIAYGHPDYDIASLVYQFSCIPDEVVVDLYHTTKDHVKEFWQAFAMEYYGLNTLDQVKDKEHQLEPFLGLHAIRVIAKFGLNERRYSYLKDSLLDKL